VVISFAELLGEGQIKSGSNGVPFTYTNPYASNSLDQVTYYLHDHPASWCGAGLGNMRVTYSAACKLVNPTQPAIRFLGLEHAADYYPYGSILREYVNGAQEKYLTTHHERDTETGLDYRGARYYDSDVARFLSIDPLAAKYPFYSPYAFSGNRVIDAVELEGLEPAGLNTMNGTYTTANDANSQYGQWDSQVIYPSGGPPAIGGSDSKFLATLWSLDRSLNLEGSNKQFHMRTFTKSRLAGGFTMVDDYANGTNNADRAGDPSGTWNVTAIKARAEVNAGPERFGTRLNPGHGGGWVENVPNSASSGSGAAGEYANLVKAKADQSESAPVIRVSSASSSYQQARANAAFAHTGGTGGPIVKQMDSGWNPLNGLVWQDQTMSDGAHKYFTWNNETKERVEVTFEQFTAGSK